MLPGPIIIRSCTSCKKAIEQPTIASGNTFGAKYWTDGKQEAPMLPDYPRLVKCPHCSNMLWIDEAKEVAQSEPLSHPKKYKGAKAYIVPTGEDYLAYLGTVEIDKEKEFYLRLQAWWASNDKYRQNPSDSVSLTIEVKRNLDFLYSMLDVGDPSDRIMKAEIARELGRYEECAILLNHKFDDAFIYVADTIRQLAQARSTKVAELHYD